MHALALSGVVHIWLLLCYGIIMLFIVIGVGTIGIVNHELLFRPPYYRTEIRVEKKEMTCTIHRFITNQTRQTNEKL